jgi:hypothetical protein
LACGRAKPLEITAIPFKLLEAPMLHLEVPMLHGVRRSGHFTTRRLEHGSEWLSIST